MVPTLNTLFSCTGLEKDVQTPNVADAFKLAFMLGDVRLAEEKEGVAGDVYILDASVATPTHFSKFTPTLVKKFLVCVQVCKSVKFTITIYHLLFPKLLASYNIHIVYGIEPMKL